MSRPMVSQAMAVRQWTAIIAGLCYFITIPFLILVLIGNTHINGFLDDIFFFKLDVSHIIPISVENSNLLNSVARSLGLHDFYQVGVWSYCEGYNDEGVTFCSPPKSFFWFDPVEVLVGELLAGARIALPSEVVTILTLLRIGSQVMYAFFMSGIVLNCVLLLLTPLVLKTRWFSLCTALIGFVAGVVLTVAAVIATVISVAAKIALTAQDQLNIHCDIGGKMFVFMWIAALATDFAFILHAAMGCCCAPDKRGGSRVGSPSEGMQEKVVPSPLGSFMRRRNRMSS
ncbi:SUR7/PalI family domain-containing protein [Trichoderma aethiopicum]